MAGGRRPTVGVQVVGWLLVAGLALLVLKWLLITAAVLAVPFGLWWLVDRSRRQQPALATPVPAAVSPAVPTPRPAPLPTPSPAPVPLTVVPARPPAPHALPSERRVTVTREEDHQDVLAVHHHPGARPTPVTAELWSSTVSRGKYRGSYAVEVRVGGRRVGELTAAMSARYRHLVDLAGPVRCQGLITHGSRGFQVDLRLPEVA